MQEKSQNKLPIVLLPFAIGIAVGLLLTTGGVLIGGYQQQRYTPAVVDAETDLPPSTNAAPPLQTAQSEALPTLAPAQESSLEQLRASASKALESPSVSVVAEVLYGIEASQFPEEQLVEVEDIETRLIQQLRESVKYEVKLLQDEALQAGSYREGAAKLSECAETLALFPLSEEPDALNEAEELSIALRAAQHRLDSIRRARYNTWAASKIESSLKILRAEAPDYKESALAELSTIEPSHLETSTAALYGYAIEQMMEEYRDSEKAKVAQALNDPAVVRTTSEEF